MLPYMLLPSLVSSDPRPSGVKQVSDGLRDLHYFSAVYVPSLTRISDETFPTYRKSESDLPSLKSPKHTRFRKKHPTYRKPTYRGTPVFTSFTSFIDM